MSQNKAAARKNCVTSFPRARARPLRMIDACEKTITQKTYLGLEKKKKKKSITANEWKLKGEGKDETDAGGGGG